MFWESVSWFGGLYFFLLVIGVFTWYGKKKVAIGLTCLMVLESFLILGAKNFFGVARPEGATQSSYSFPSGHTSKAGAVAGYFFSRKHRWLLLLPIMVGISRVMVGEHAWVDVVAGGFFGILIGFVFNKLWNRLPVLNFGRHHRVFFIFLSLAAFLVAVFVEFQYINYAGAIAGLAIGFLLPEERASGKNVAASGVVGFALLLFLIGSTAGYFNFFLNLFLGLWISVVNPGMWELYNKNKSL